MKIDTTPPSITEKGNEFQTDQVLTVAGGHFVHDTYTAFIAPLLPIIQERLGTSYTLTGSLAIFAQIPSLLNPFIGLLADRISLRYFIILAPAITATLMSMMGLAPTYLWLAIILFAAGISLAAFHAPAPAMIGRISGNRIGLGMSIFMASGELGRAIGPLLIAWGISNFTLEGSWRLMFIGWFVSLFLYLRLRHISARPQAKKGSFDDIREKAWKIFPYLSWVMLARAFLMVAITTYLPIFMSDVKEANIWLSSASLTILEFAGVAGALLTGTISDRFGRMRMLALLLGIAPFFLFAFLYGPSNLNIPMLILLGLTAISPTPVIMAFVQDNFPDSRAFANGIYIALNFLIRALGIWVVGLMADNLGLTNAFLWSGLLAFLSLPAIFILDRKTAV